MTKKKCYHIIHYIHQRGHLMAEAKTYKISLLKNTRFVVFMALLIGLFLTNLTLYQVFRIQNSEWNLAFVIVSVILITVICYSIFKMQGVRGLQITLGDTEMTYNRSRFENEVIEYRNIKYLGYFKKNPDDESKFSFFDYRACSQSAACISPLFAPCNR